MQIKKGQQTCVILFYGTRYYFTSKMNALRLDERLDLETLEDRIWKLKKSIQLLDDELDRIYLD